MNIRETMHLRLSALSVFGALKNEPVVRALEAALAEERASAARRVAHCARLSALLMESGESLTRHLFGRALRDENAYVRRVAAGAAISPALRSALAAELDSLEQLGALEPKDLMPPDVPFPVAGWAVEPIDFSEGYHRHMAEIGRVGYGIFYDHTAFLIREGALLPIRHPDPVDLDGLTGYERERAAVMDNTRALMAGRPCANVLLYGDSGTGKSTCVKAIANRFAGDGLRLIEVRKDQLEEIPGLIDRLSGNPLKFILFIDDLSFSTGGGDFAALKAILEGSVAARTANIAIYATSNRRHLVRENFADRQGGEVHLRDTLEETASLSERFGLTVTFLRPDKALYIAIVERYLRAMGLPCGADTARAAEAFALARGGRSPRAARQFAENLAAAAPSPAHKKE